MPAQCKRITPPPNEIRVCWEPDNPSDIWEIYGPIHNYDKEVGMKNQHLWRQVGAIAGVKKVTVFKSLMQS